MGCHDVRPGVFHRIPDFANFMLVIELVNNIGLSFVGFKRFGQY
jgi:hypothetical protein